MKQKAIVYGAGDYGFRFACDDAITSYDVLCFVDKNHSSKKRIGAYEVENIDSLKKYEYDVVIIAVYKWSEILGEIKKHFSFDDSKIRIYDIHSKKRVLTIQEKEKWDNSLKIERINAVVGIKNELLFEAWNAGEFDEVDSIYVFGDDEDFKAIKRFFYEVNKRLYIEPFDSLGTIIDERSKIIFANVDYLETYREYKKSGKLTSRNWCVIPLFDVKDAVNI